jgi:preprotein translocase subunit SecG
MNTIQTILVVVQVVSALSIIGLVLLQHGKGADMGAAFGSGASGSLFGATGSSNFLSKATAAAAVVFFSATMALAFVGNQPAAGAGGVMDRLPQSTVPGAIDNSVPGVPQAPAGDASVPVPAEGNQPAQIPQ